MSMPLNIANIGFVKIILQKMRSTRILRIDNNVYAF